MLVDQAMREQLAQFSECPELMLVEKIEISRRVEDIKGKTTIAIVLNFLSPQQAKTVWRQRQSIVASVRQLGLGYAVVFLVKRKLYGRSESANLTNSGSVCKKEEKLEPPATDPL